MTGDFAASGGLRQFGAIVGAKIAGDGAARMKRASRRSVDRRRRLSPWDDAFLFVVREHDRRRREKRDRIWMCRPRDQIVGGGFLDDPAQMVFEICCLKLTTNAWREVSSWLLSGINAEIDGSLIAPSQVLNSEIAERIERYHTG